MLCRCRKETFARKGTWRAWFLRKKEAECRFKSADGLCGRFRGPGGEREDNSYGFSRKLSASKIEVEDLAYGKNGLQARLQQNLRRQYKYQNTAARKKLNFDMCCFRLKENCECMEHGQMIIVENFSMSLEYWWRSVLLRHSCQILWRWRSLSTGIRQDERFGSTKFSWSLLLDWWAGHWSYRTFKIAVVSGSASVSGLGSGRSAGSRSWFCRRWRCELFMSW